MLSFNYFIYFNVGLQTSQVFMSLYSIINLLLRPSWHITVVKFKYLRQYSITDNSHSTNVSMDILYLLQHDYMIMFSMVYSSACYFYTPHYLWWWWYSLNDDTNLIALKSYIGRKYAVWILDTTSLFSLLESCIYTYRNISRISLSTTMSWCLCVIRVTLLYSMNIKWCIKSDLLISWFPAKHVHLCESLNPSCMLVYR